MARNNDRDRSSKRAPKERKEKPGRRPRPKICNFCRDRIDYVDYKDVSLLRKYISDRGKIRARTATGNCQQHQRDVAVAIKVARELILLPYTQRTVTTERPARGAGRGRNGPRPGEGRAEPEVETSEAVIENDVNDVLEEEAVAVGAAETA